MEAKVSQKGLGNITDELDFELLEPGQNLLPDFDIEASSPSPSKVSQKELSDIQPSNFKSEEALKPVAKPLPADVPFDFANIELDNLNPAPIDERATPSRSTQKNLPAKGKKRFVSAVDVGIPTRPAPRPPVPQIDDPKLIGRKKATPKEKPKHSSNFNKDRFGFYLAIVVLTSLALTFVAVMYYREWAANTNEASYVTLPKQIIERDNQIIRISITLKINPSNQQWTIDNRRALIEYFKAEIFSMPDYDLNKEDDLRELTQFLKAQLNTNMHTDKIEEVLIDEILTQTRRK